jgi:hypothetical protein
MKKIQKLLTYSLVAATVLSASTGCKKFKDFGDTNVNPNGSSEVLTSALITNIEAGLGTPVGGALGVSALQPGLYCQYFAEATYPGTSLYSLPQINSSGTYAGVLMDCQVIINKNTDDKTKGTNSVLSGGANKNQIAFAKIIKSYVFWKLTDCWGDLPYSEALKGASNLTPKYDAQLDIYKGILADLTSAVSDFDDAGVALRGDVIFSGDNTKWRKTANSLRMLVAIRLSKRFPAAGDYAALQFKAAAEDLKGHIQTNAENFTINYPGANYRNPWFAAGASEDNAVSKTFTDVLTGLSDARIAALASSANGVPYGVLSITSGGAKIFSASYRTETSPLVIVSAASVWLAKAEAIELGWITGDSKVAYETGVTASYGQWSIPVPAAYLTTGPANYTTGAGVTTAIGGPATPGSNAATASKLQRIALQQWIAFYPDGLQGWSNWRKNEYIVGGVAKSIPDIRPTVNFLPSSTGKIVRRYVYGTTEYALNNAALLVALTGLTGGDKQESRVWWDKP